MKIAIRTLTVILAVWVVTTVAHAQATPPVNSTGMHDTASPFDTRPVKSVAQQLDENTKLTARLQGLLPKGIDVRAASGGFNDLDSFAAAIHAADNLKIPFEQLSGKLTGTHSVDLKKAIHELKPDVDTKAEAKKATEQAKQDIKDSKKKS